MSEILFKCEVTETGYVAGELHEEGEILSLTERQKECGLRRGRIKVLDGQSSKGPSFADTLTVKQIKEQLDLKGVDYSSCEKKADFVDLLKQTLAAEEGDSNDPLE